MVREHVADVGMVLEHCFDVDIETVHNFVQQILGKIGNQGWQIMMCHDDPFVIAIQWYYHDDDNDEYYDERWYDYLRKRWSPEWNEERKKFVKRRIDYDEGGE